VEQDIDHDLFYGSVARQNAAPPTPAPRARSVYLMGDGRLEGRASNPLRPGELAPCPGRFDVFVQAPAIKRVKAHALSTRNASFYSVQF